MRLYPVRFAAAWLVCFLIGLAAVVAAAAAVTGRLPSRPDSPQPTAPACASVGCATIGDNATYTLHGRISSIQEPQPGVRCVQVQDANSAGQFCARTP